MSKSLAQFKNDITVGTVLECTEFIWQASPNSPKTEGVPPAMQGPRTVATKNTVGFMFDTQSYFEWPKASEMKYVGNTITLEPKNSEGFIFQKRVYTIA